MGNPKMKTFFGNSSGRKPEFFQLVFFEKKLHSGEVEYGESDNKRFFLGINPTGSWNFSGLCFLRKIFILG